MKQTRLKENTETKREFAMPVRPSSTTTTTTTKFANTGELKCTLQWAFQSNFGAANFGLVGLGHELTHFVASLSLPLLLLLLLLRRFFHCLQSRAENKESREATTTTKEAHPTHFRLHGCEI